MRQYTLSGCDPCASGVVGGPSCAVVSSDVQQTCMCDDVNGDGTSIVRFVTATLVTVATDGTVTSSKLGDYTDATLATAYTPVNPVDCCDIGTAAPYPNTYAEVQPVCATIGGVGPATLLQLTIRDKATHIRVGTIYEDPASGAQVTAALVQLVDSSLCSECCTPGTTPTTVPHPLLQAVVSAPQAGWAAGQAAKFDSVVYNTAPAVLSLNPATGAFTIGAAGVWRIRATIQGTVSDPAGWGYYALAKVAGPVISAGGIVLPTTYPFPEGVSNSFEWVFETTAPGEQFEIRNISTNGNTVTIRSDVYSGFVVEQIV